MIHTWQQLTYIHGLGAELPSHVFNPDKQVYHSHKAVVFKDRSHWSYVAMEGCSKKIPIQCPISSGSLSHGWKSEIDNVNMDSLIIYGVEGKTKWGVSLKNFRGGLMLGKGGYLFYIFPLEPSTK